MPEYRQKNLLLKLKSKMNTIICSDAIFRNDTVHVKVVLILSSGIRFVFCSNLSFEYRTPNTICD